MKTNISVLLVVMLILLSVTACSNKYDHKDSKTKETPTEKSENPITDELVSENESDCDKPTPKEHSIQYDIVDKQVIDRTDRDVVKAFNAYKLVLTNQSEYIRFHTNKRENVSQLANSIANHKSEIARYAIINLDDDNLPEVVLAITQSGYDYEYFILKYQNDNIYGYPIGIRAFNCLKIDGTFLSSSGASDSSICTLSFTENGSTYTLHGYSHNDIYTLYSGWDSKTGDNSAYFINSERVTKEEFDNLCKYQDQKPNATWYEFSEENINNL